MNQYNIHILETIAVIALVLSLKWVFTKLLEKIRKNFGLQKQRIKMVNKAKNLIIYLIAFVSISIIWAVDQKDIFVFISSFLTILGVALFAQWSVLSNITASIILFVNHPAKIGDHLLILDKDYPLKGRISDIGLFFIILKTEEDEKITIPNSLILNKMIKIVTKPEPKPKS
ncbi:MAG: mechanosensitive ion channel [Saprospiraceae bacterium]|nr:mechanosensitive ion channel [Saprospiraceae bacterium]MCB9325430.1 mechanosensitive ion channel [Lewinellaceae bacterium]